MDPNADTRPASSAADELSSVGGALNIVGENSIPVFTLNVPLEILMFGNINPVRA